eukprot:1525786-Amphidinium_carterae.1
MGGPKCLYAVLDRYSHLVLSSLLHMAFTAPSFYIARMQPMRLSAAWLASGIDAGTHETPNIRRDDQPKL